MRIAIASDHAGFQLKTLLLTRLSVEPDVSFVDLGTYAASPPVDYPDYARAAAEAVPAARSLPGYDLRWVRPHPFRTPHG